MPEQHSARGNTITGAGFEAPFDTPIWPYGVGGLNLTDALDLIPVGEYSRLTNLTHEKDRELTTRDGQTSLLTGGSVHHSIRRLADPDTGTFTYFVGVDQTLRRGSAGVLTTVDSGYSGDPLTLVPYRPPMSGEPWLFVADRSRMRKVRMDGLDLPIGLPAPTLLPVPALDVEQKTIIANFRDDGTEAANWTGIPGYSYADTPVITDTPTVNELTDPVAGNGVYFTTDPGSAGSPYVPDGYYSAWGVPCARDLSKVGTADAEEEDLFHLWLNFSHVDFIKEFRIYLVCSVNFQPIYLPGVSYTGVGNVNSDAYVKTFSGSDLASFIQAQEVQTTAAERVRVREIRDAKLRELAVRDTRRTQEATRAARDAARTITVSSAAGSDTWMEFGKIGVPVRRSDFQRLGVTAGRDWSTITGLIMLAVVGEKAGTITVRMTDFYLTGGSGPDTSEAGAQPYDYRYTDYDPRTGAESCPSPEMETTDMIDAMRRTILVTPPAAADGNLRQRLYRRGGSLNDDWYYVDENAANGAVITDDFTDDAISTAGTLALDHYEPVSTIDAAGNTVNAQPVPAIFGPYEDLLFACGDPYRPGHLYWCASGQPDHWPPANNVEVCAPSEELMHGCLYGNQPWVFSRERLYALYTGLSSGVGVRALPSGCQRGLAGRWAFCVGLGGIYFVAPDGIFRTSGGPEEKLSQKLTPLFRGESRNGYAPINFAVEEALRLAIYHDRLHFLYEDTNGERQVLVYHLYDQTWRHYDFAQPLACLYADESVATQAMLLGGNATGKTYTFSGTTDDGTAISWLARTGAWDLGRPREDKLLGDQILDVDLQGVAATLQNFLNAETVTNPAQALTAATGRQRLILDGFGTSPQRARTISTEVRGVAAGPILYFLGTAITAQPDMTVNRVTNWDDLGNPDESYVTGITLDCDTAGLDRITYFERDFGGVVSTMDTEIVNCDGRHKIKYSWPALPANQVRIRPDQHCTPWILYRADWIAQAEPPRVAHWDIHFEAEGDAYYTGLDLLCDTGNVEKTLAVEVDGVALVNPTTGLATFPVTANGRQWVHLTLPWGRGHVFHFWASDDTPGLLYKHKWWVEAEPSEQHNWNQNFSILGSRADKWLKAVVFECDTYGVNKSVTIEADGAVVETLTVNTNGRKVVQLALTTQQLGRVWRVWPIDHQPGRLYSMQPVFDEEPFCLTRWETQELDHDQPGFQTPIAAQITLKSTAPVTLTVRVTRNQGSQYQAALTEDFIYTIPTTGGVKEKRYVPFDACKGVLFKYLLESGAAFWLYQEESSVVIQPWGAEQALEVHPFGNADADRSRAMQHSTIAAAHSGGGTA